MTVERGRNNSGGGLEMCDAVWEDRARAIRVHNDILRIVGNDGIADTMLMVCLAAIAGKLSAPA